MPRLSAQATVTVSGRVLDQTQAPLPGVIIDLVAGSRALTTTTDMAGRFQFDAVPTGKAELTCRLLNFSVQRRVVNVTVAPAAPFDVTMMLAINADCERFASRGCNRQWHSGIWVSLLNCSSSATPERRSLGGRAGATDWNGRIMPVCAHG